jgi:hypothetical protein
MPACRCAGIDLTSELVSSFVIRLSARYILLVFQSLFYMLSLKVRPPHGLRRRSGRLLRPQLHRTG